MFTHGLEVLSCFLNLPQPPFPSPGSAEYIPNPPSYNPTTLIIIDDYPIVSIFSITVSFVQKWWEVCPQVTISKSVLSVIVNISGCIKDDRNIDPINSQKAMKDNQDGDKDIATNNARTTFWLFNQSRYSSPTKEKFPQKLVKQNLKAFLIRLVPQD